MKIYGKKGFEWSLNFIITWVILPLVAGILILSLIIVPVVASLMPTDARDSIGLAENYCNLNAGFRNSIIKATEGLYFAGVGGAFVARTITIPLWFCHDRSVKVDATNYAVCDPDKKFGFKDNSDVRACAAQQFYNLGKRCWSMYGQDRFNMVADELDSKWPCFKAVVRDLGQDSTIGEIEVTAASVRADNCKFLQNNNNPGGQGCGRYDGIDFQDWLSTAAIKTGKTYYVCFDENGPSPDQIDYRENPC